MAIDSERVVFVLRVNHALETVPEHRQVLKGIEHLGHLFQRHEETAHQQERNDQDWHQSHHHSCIRKHRRKQQSERRTHEGAELQRKHGFEEHSGSVREVAGEVGNADEQKISQYLDRQHSQSSTEIVGRGGVSVAEAFSDEDGPFEVE